MRNLEAIGDVVAELPDVNASSDPDDNLILATAIADLVPPASQGPGGRRRGRFNGSSQCCAAGTHAVVRPPMVRCSMRSPRVVRASARLPQRRWNSHVRG